jgi:PAS domain S-box-containing protein
MSFNENDKQEWGELRLKSLVSPNNVSFQGIDVVPEDVSQQSLIWRVDRDYRIVMVSKRVAEMRGMTVAEMIGQDGFVLYPTEAERYYADNLTVFNSGQPLLGILEPHSSTGTGERRWMRTDKIPLFDSKGVVESIVISAVDVTREIELQNKSSLRHSVRTPITSILGFAELIANGETSDLAEIRKFAELILNQGQKLLEVFEEISELGNQPPKLQLNATSPSWINLNFFLQNWTLGVYATDATHKLQLRGRMAPKCPAFLHVDTNVVATILRALCDRVVIAEGATFADLSIEFKDSEVGGSSTNRVLVVVSDDGKTVPQEVFQAFLKKGHQPARNERLDTQVRYFALSPILILAHKLAIAANGTLEAQNDGLVVGNRFVLSLPQLGIQEV